MFSVTVSDQNKPEPLAASPHTPLPAEDASPTPSACRLIVGQVIKREKGAGGKRGKRGK